MARSYPKGQEIAVQICKALGLEPGLVARVILDFSIEGPVMVYVKLIADHKILEVDWSMLKGMEIKVVE